VSNHNATAKSQFPNEGLTTPKNKNSKHSLLQSASSPIQNNKVFVRKDRFSLFSNSTEPSEVNDNILDMDLEYESIVPTITTKPPPPIFIRRVDDFNSSCNSIQDITKSDQFSCKNSTNGVIVLQRNTNLPLPLFFIDLEPAINNKDIFLIRFLHYTKIKIEEPRSNKLIIQCLRCQGFVTPNLIVIIPQNAFVME